ncbi:MAG: UDP-glucuronic acid decarboxylase family protein [Candidatus Bathyarchaeia archaeon]
MLDDVILSDLEFLCKLQSVQSLRGESILITGGAGFIGSWLCDVLVKLDVDLVCVDNLSSGNLKNIEYLKERVGFRFIQASVEDLDYSPANRRFRFILHLASRASPRDYQAHPVETLRANSIGTLKALEIARRCDATFLLTSTSEVYGDPEIIPTPETYWGRVNPVGSRSPYDEGKRFSEALCKAYERSQGLDVRIARIFNTYGPRLRPEGLYGRVISRFITQAINGEDITVYGDGTQTRSFCYITDTVRALLTMLTSMKAMGEILNIGNTQETRIIDLAWKIKELTGSSSKIILQPLPEDDPKRRCPDISKAKELLGWQPEVSLDTGLRRTISWFSMKR